MGELSNALQGKLSSRKGHVKDPGGSQLDLFSSLSDREATAPKIIMSTKPDAAPAPRPEPELVLPPAGNPPDVAADVRAVLSESGPARPVDSAAAGEAGHPPLRTGIYHRPARTAPPPASPRPPPPSARPPAGAKFRWLAGIRGWFAGIELDRRAIALIVVSFILIALIGYFTAPCARTAVEEPVAAATAEAETPPAATPASPVTPAAVSAAPAAPAAPAAAPAAPAAAAAPDWKIPGTTATQNGGAVLVRFNDPVFASADKISIEGMRALKLLGARLGALKSGARVVVTGYTDDVPLSKPTDQFKSNADIAAARAKAAVDHLALFAKANAALVFDPQTGDPRQAPYPNDSPQNRRLNRTVTVQIIPAP